MRFYTSDTHFGHGNILRFEQEARPFNSTEIMDEVLIANWNATVGPTDEVWHLGDVALGTIADSLPKISRLNGIKILVPGNHDRVFSGTKEAQRAKFDPLYREVFDYIEPEITSITIGGVSVQVSHFPYSGDHMEEDRYPDKRPFDDGRPLIHGHVHSLWKTNGRQFNVGVDVNDLTPVPETAIIDWLDTL